MPLEKNQVGTKKRDQKQPSERTSNPISCAPASIPLAVRAAGEEAMHLGCLPRSKVGRQSLPGGSPLCTHVFPQELPQDGKTPIQRYVNISPQTNLRTCQLQNHSTALNPTHQQTLWYEDDLHDLFIRKHLLPRGDSQLYCLQAPSPPHAHSSSSKALGL